MRITHDFASIVIMLLSPQHLAECVKLSSRIGSHEPEKVATDTNDKSIVSEVNFCCERSLAPD